MNRKLQELGYKPENENTFVKVIKRFNDYVDDNGNFLFRSTICVGLFIKFEGTRIVDSYIKPLETFKLRAQEDIDSFANFYNELLSDLDELESDAADA